MFGLINWFISTFDPDWTNYGYQIDNKVINHFIIKIIGCYSFNVNNKKDNEWYPYFLPEMSPKRSLILSG